MKIIILLITLVLLTSYVKKETDSNKIFNAKNDTVSNQALYAILNSDSSLSYKILNSYAKKLDIKFNDKDTKKKFDNYVKTTYGGDQ